MGLYAYAYATSTILPGAVAYHVVISLNRACFSATLALLEAEALMEKKFITKSDGGKQKINGKQKISALHAATIRPGLLSLRQKGLALPCCTSAAGDWGALSLVERRRLGQAPFRTHTTFPTGSIFLSPCPFWQRLPSPILFCFFPSFPMTSFHLSPTSAPHPPPRCSCLVHFGPL